MPITVMRKAEWGLVYYCFQGTCTSIDLLAAIKIAASDPYKQAVTVFDLLNGDLDMNQEDMVQIIAINKNLFKDGLVTTHAAVLTTNKGLEIFVKAFGLLSFNEHTELSAFSSLHDALIWIGLTDHEQEIKKACQS